MEPTAWKTVIVLLYLAAVLGLGIRARRRGSPGREEFALAGRGMGAFPLGLSVMITLFSAVNFTAFPTEVIGHGLYVWASVPVFLLAAWPVAHAFVPWFREQPGISGYAWLEDRYGAGVRRTAALLFLAWRLAWMATALHATGRIVAPLIGLPAPWIMTAAALLAWVYTSVGGLRAVIWTDVLQFGVLVSSLLLAVSWTAAHAPGGLPGILDRGLQSGLFRPIRPADPDFWGWHPHLRITFWSGTIGTWVAFVARYSADQMVLQRYRAARSLRDAQRGIWINAWAAVLVLTLLTLLGLAAAAAPCAEGLAPSVRLAALFRSLPGGIAGLVAAALLAATMSSMDSGLHACTVTLEEDFGRRLPTGRSPVPPMTALLVAALLLALPMGRLGGLFAVVNRVINGLGAPLLALVLAGIYGRGMTARGLSCGALLGFAAAVAVSIGVSGLALHYYAVVNLLVTLLLCRACSAGLP